MAADPLVWADAVADTGTLDLTWADSGLAADTTYHYQVSARNAVGLSDPAAAQGTTRPQLTLLATATYPLSAHQWPAATAPVTHTWSAHDAAVQLDLVAQGAGGGGWYRALRFGASAGGPYWLPANAVIVSGTTTALPQTPGAPGDLQTSNLQGQVTLTWTAPPTGGTVTGYRLWRQTGEAAWTVLGSELGAATRTYTDSTVTAGTTYQYRLQARAAAGYGVRTAAVTAAVTAPPVAPAPPAYFGVAQIAATTAQLFWDPVAGATGYEVELRQAWYAADHAAARVRLPRVGTVTLRTGADSTVELTVLRTGTLVELRGLPASYSYWDLYVRATNAGGASGWAETYVSNDAAALAPRQPTGLRGLRRAAGTADLHWDAVPGATAYRVYFDFPDDDRGAAGWDWLPYRDVAVTVTGATATVSGLPPTPGPWSLRVSALSGGRESVRAAALAVSTAAAARVPGVPPALTAAPGADSQMQLSWTAPVDAGTQPLTGYRIERSADVNPRVWTEVLADSGLTATTWADSALAAATPYHYQVSAHNAVGTGQPSAEAPGTTRPQAALRVTAAYPLTAHQGPAATAPVTHTWTAPAAAVPLDVVAQAAGGSWYRVLRFGHAPGGPYWLPAAAVTVTGATTDLPQVPAAPTGLTAAPSDESQMQLSWQAAPTGSAATGYRIERAADVQPRMWTEVRADSGTPATTWADSGLAAATVYHYRVTGRNAAGLGTPAEAAPGTTRPQLTLLASAPYPLLAQAWPLATAPVTHTWSAHDAAITLDVMAQGAGGGGWYRVLRFGASADGPYWLPASAVSVTGATMALPQAPGGPGDLMPPTATHNSVTLTWTAPTTGGTVTGYRLWRQTGEADFRVLGPDLTAATLTFTDTPVLASTLYQYRVQARAAAGYGPRTPAVSVTTAAPPRTPGRPTELRAAPGADSQMQLTWAAPVDPGTPPLTGYRMERSADVLPRVWTEVLADTGTPDGSWTDSGLAAATTYHYQVSARNAVGVGQPSGATSGQSRPQLALRVTATYPLTAHAWPAATAPVTQTWSAHDAQVVLDLTAQGAGGDGWYRALRFGQAARGPYWLPARAVTVTGATSDLPQAPGAPADLQTTETQGQVVLIWNAPATGGTVTGYRLWRQRGEAAWAALDVALAAHTYTYTDTAVTTDTPYQYRLQAQSAAGYGVRTAALSAAVTPPPPGDLTYFGAAQTAATTVELAWDAVPGASGYEVEIQQSHGDAYVLLPAAGTFALRTGPATTDSVTVTVTRTGPTLQLTGLPASYSSWHLYLRATNAGGSSGWRGATVSNNPQQWAPSAPTGLTGRRSAAGTVALSWGAVTGATGLPALLPIPGRHRGPGRLGLAALPRGDGDGDGGHGHGQWPAPRGGHLGAARERPQRLRRVPGLPGLSRRQPQRLTLHSRGRSLGGLAPAVLTAIYSTPISHRGNVDMSLDVKLTLGKEPHITVSGQTLAPLRPDQLDDVLQGRDDLIQRVEHYQGYGRPDGVHLSDDGLSGKLRGTFSHYGWQPATLTHTAQAAQIVAVTAVPVILADQLAENPSTEVASTQKAEISRTVTNTVSREAHWEVSTTVTQTVSYEIGGDAEGGKVGGSTALSFTAAYGESSGSSESVEVGSTAGVEAVLQPGQAVVFELGITTGRIEAQVTYARQLTGGVFVNYGKRQGSCMTATPCTRTSAKPCAWTSMPTPAPPNAIPAPMN